MTTGIQNEKGMKRFEDSPGSMPNTLRMASTRPRTYTPHAHTLARKNIRPILPPNSGPSERLIMSDGAWVKARLSNQRQSVFYTQCVHVFHHCVMFKTKKGNPLITTLLDTIGPASFDGSVG